MSDQTRITVSRTIDAPAKGIFDVLSNPERHQQIDGSGFVVSDSKTDRITGTGQVFTMNMNSEHMGGDYQTDNHVTGFDDGKLIAWQTAPAGDEPPGWEWMWELESEGSDTTLVTQTYSWDKVDAETAQKLGLPLVSEDQMEDSLNNLAAAVSGG